LGVWGFGQNPKSPIPNPQYIFYFNSIISIIYYSNQNYNIFLKINNKK